MVIIILLFLFLTFLFAYNKSNMVIDATIKTFLVYTFLSVVFAEGLSAFSSYSAVYLVGLWALSCIIIMGYLYKNVDCIDMLKRLAQTMKSFIFEHKLLVSACVAIVMLTVMRAALFPPQNVDSLMYHLSRAFFYYKNEGIANFPSSYAWSNYTGPLNAIFMTQLLILQGGSDFFHNFIQFIPWLISALAVYGITVNLGANKKWGNYGRQLGIYIV